MKKIIEFCKENNFDFELETLSNGVSRVVIKPENSAVAKEIRDKAENNGFFTDATAYGNDIVNIYTREDWEVYMKRFKTDSVLTIDDMLNTLNKAKALLGGKAPFNVVNDFGTLNLINNSNIVISNGALVINASDWGGPNKDIDF